MIRTILFVFALIFFSPSFGQGRSDSLKKDSVDIYKKIHTFASKRKITYRLYRLVFNEPEKIEKLAPTTTTVKKVNDPFKRYQGKIIRHIEIITYDPFDKIKADTVIDPSSILEKAANHIHRKSHRYTVRNNLLFRKNDTLDAFSLKESERLLRETGIVSSATITVRPIKKVKDSVDVIVVVQDKFSLSATGGLTPSRGDVRLRERNFFGTGHRLETSLFQEFNGNTSVQGSYSVPNIRRTFTSITGYFSNRENFHYNGASLDRPFYSPLTKWAGGASAFKLRSIQTFKDDPLIYPHKYYTHDIWIGRAFSYSSAESKRASRIVTGLRYKYIHFLERAPFEVDKYQVNQDSRLFLGAVAFSNREYYKDKFIYKMGEEEDVPEGRLLSLVGGYELREINPRTYVGARTLFGNHINGLGHLSMEIEYGTFLSNAHPQNGVMSFGANYFTDLKMVGRWSSRVFIDFRVVNGIERTPGEKVYLGGREGVYGMRRELLAGENKASLSFRSVVFSPYDLLGFRIATIAFAGFGMLHDDVETIHDSRVYQVYGIGFLMRNRHLASSTIQFSFGFYPGSPMGTNWFKFNPLTSYNFGFRDYSFSRPEIVHYR